MTYISKLLLLLSFLVVFLFPQLSNAQLKDFVETDWSLLTPMEKTEFRSEVGIAEGATQFYTFGFVHGITNQDNLAAFVDVFKSSGESFDVSSIQLALKSKSFSSLKGWLDPALHVGYLRCCGTDIFEGKLLGTKDFGNFTFSVNLILQLQPEAQQNACSRYAIGFALPYSDRVKYGVEFFGGGYHYVMPGLYLNLSPITKLNIGYAKGLSAYTYDWQVRTNFIVKSENW